MAKYYDVDELVRSLIGRPLGEILEQLNGAAAVHEHWLRMSRKQRDAYEGTYEYAAFAKAARWYLLDAPGNVPSNAERVGFGRIRPLLEDMVARGIAPSAAAEWLAAR